MKKKAISILLIIAMILSLIPMTVLTVSAENLNEPHVKVGDPLGDVLYSDIVAFIDGYAIPTSIKNGTTMVVVEDLLKYGFDVVWNGADRTLKIERNEKKVFKPLTVEKDTTHKPGTFKCKYVYTDIKTYISGELIESFAINGVTLIDFELLARYGKLNWDGSAREIKLTLNKPVPPPEPIDEIKPDPEIPEGYEWISMNGQSAWDIYMAQNVYGLGNASTYSKLGNAFTWTKFEPVLKSFTQKFGKTITYKAPANKENYITKGDVISYLHDIVTAALKIKKPGKAIDYFVKNGLINISENGNYPLDDKCAGDEMIVLAVRVYEYICYELKLDSKGFFWKVTGKNNTVYLLGSIHITDGSLYPLNKEIEKAFDSSQHYVVEVLDNPSDADWEYYDSKAYITNGKTIKSYLDPDIYDFYVMVCENLGIEKSIYNYLQPWYAQFELAYLAYAMTSENDTVEDAYDNLSAMSALGIEEHFMTRAKNSGKDLIQLESIRHQADFLSSFSRDLQEVMLFWTLVDFYEIFTGEPFFDDEDYTQNSSADSLISDLDIWKKGDEKALIKANGIDVEYDDPIFNEYNDIMLTKRNKAMVKKIIEFLTKGKDDYFVVVGAAHMLGNEGIVQLLIDAGYTVERIK